MTLRARLTLVAAGVVAVVVALASVTTYFVMRHELEAQLDGSLRSTAHSVQASNQIGGPGDYGGNLAEVVDSEGNYVAASPGLNLPATDDAQVLAVANSPNMHSGFFRDTTAKELESGLPVRLREYAAPLRGGGASRHRRACSRRSLLPHFMITARGRRLSTGLRLFHIFLVRASFRA